MGDHGNRSGRWCRRGAGAGAGAGPALERVQGPALERAQELARVRVRVQAQARVRVRLQERAQAGTGSGTVAGGRVSTGAETGPVRVVATMPRHGLSLPTLVARHHTE